MEAEIGAPRSTEQVLDLLVGFGASEFLANIDEDAFGHAQTYEASHLQANEFGYQGSGAMSGAAEFHNVSETVVGLGERWQRAALAQGRDIARNGHMARLFGRFREFCSEESVHSGMF